MSRRLVLLSLILAIAWSGLAALYGQTAQPRVGCQVNSNKISTGQSANFTLFVDQLPPLTAYTLTLTYDPLAVQFQDQNQTREGVNLMPSGAFPPEAITSNVVDTVLGEIELAVSVPSSSQLTGQFEVLGTGTILGVNQTVALFEFKEIVLYDHQKTLLNRASYGVEECFVEIGDSGTPTPEPTATYFLFALLTSTPTPPGFTSIAPTATPTSTPIPFSPLPTPNSTVTPTFTPFPTATPTETNTPEPTPTETETSIPTVVAISNPGEQSPLPTPDPNAQETLDSPSPTPNDTDTPVPVVTDTPTVEVPTPTDTLTPLPVPTETPTGTPTLTPEPPTVEPPVRPTATPIAQADRALPETIGVVSQSESSSPARTQQPYRLLAVAALFGSLALLLAFWQLYRRGG